MLFNVFIFLSKFSSLSKLSSHPFSKYEAIIHILNNDTSHVISHSVVNLVFWFSSALILCWEANKISRSFSIVWSYNNFYNRLYDLSLLCSWIGSLFCGKEGTIHCEAHNTVGVRRAQSVQWVHYRVDDWGIVVRFLARASVLFSKAPGLAIELTQPPIQWVPGAPFPRGKAVRVWTYLLTAYKWWG